jgi:hypothetical protein
MIEKSSSETNKVVQQLFVVQEGFTITAVVEAFEELTTRSPDTLILSFDITTYASLDMFGKFLHHLYGFGLIIDDDTGKTTALNPNIQYLIYIELPALSIFAQTEDQADVFWPTEETHRKTISHPYLLQLPILTLAVRNENFIFVDLETPFVLSKEARLVGSYWSLHCSSGLDLVDHLPVDQLESLTDEDISQHLIDLFDEYGLRDSKREQSHVISLLWERVVYLAQLHAAAKAEEEATTPVTDETFRQFEKFKGHFDGIFQLLVKESVDIGRDSAANQVFEEHDTFVSSIRPTWGDANDDLSSFALFDILLCSRTCETRLEKSSLNECYCFFDEEVQTQFTCQWCELQVVDQTLHVPLRDIYPGAQVLNLAEGCISGEMRALVAPIFGMKNTHSLYETVTDMGHILTSESLTRLLYMHEKRKLGSFVIYEGETGCGKFEPVCFLLNSHLCL